MIIWKGFGILAGIIPLAFYLLMQVVLGNDSPYTGVGMILGGIAVWFVGRYLNDKEGKIKVNEKTGEPYYEKTMHSMFWLEMEYWSIIAFLFGAFFIGGNFWNIEQFAMPTILGTFVAFLGYSFYVQRKTTPERNEKIKALQEEYYFANAALQTTATTPSKTAQAIQTKVKKTAETKKKKKQVTPPKTKDLTKLTEEERKKKEYFEKMRNNRGVQTQFDPSEHDRFMP